MRRLTVLLVLIALLGGWGPAVASGAPGKADSRKQEPVDLGSLGGGRTEVRAVNDHGQVVGSSATVQGEQHAFLWSRGKMVDLAPGFAQSAAIDINNRGEALVERSRTTTADQATETVLWRAGRSRPVRLTRGTLELARAITDSGVVVGTATVGSRRTAFSYAHGVEKYMAPVADGFVSVDGWNDRHGVIGSAFRIDPGSPCQCGQTVAFYWNGGAPQLISTAPYSEPTDVNNKGQVIGVSTDGAFIWSKGTLRLLSQFRSNPETSPMAINDRGVITGSSQTAEGFASGFRWVNGTYRPVGPAGTQSYPNLINNYGVIAGVFIADTGPSAPFIWSHGRFTNLSAGLNGTVSQLQDLSERGHVIATVTELDGQTHGVLWKV